MRVALVVLLVIPALGGCLQHDQRFSDPTRLDRADVVAPDDCPGAWHMGLYVTLQGRAQELPEGGHTIAMADGCHSAADIFAAHGLVLGANLTWQGEDHGTYLVAIQFWGSKTLWLVQNIDDYMHMQPHDGSRVLVAPAGDAPTILFLARNFEDFDRNDEPVAAPSGGPA